MVLERRRRRKNKNKAYGFARGFRIIMAGLVLRAYKCLFRTTNSVRTAMYHVIWTPSSVIRTYVCKRNSGRRPDSSQMIATVSYPIGSK